MCAATAGLRFRVVVPFYLYRRVRDPCRVSQFTGPLLLLLLSVLALGCAEDGAGNANQQAPVGQVAPPAQPPVPDGEPPLKAGMPQDPERVKEAKNAIFSLIVYAWLLPLLLIVILRAIFYSPDTSRLSSRKKSKSSAADEPAEPGDHPARGGPDHDSWNGPRYRI